MPLPDGSLPDGDAALAARRAHARVEPVPRPLAGSRPSAPRSGETYDAYVKKAGADTGPFFHRHGRGLAGVREGGTVTVERQNMAYVGVLHIRRTCLNPARFQQFTHIAAFLGLS